ncbi:hypothetical protein H6G54_25935 [Anabaena cylindrica FACHB-243]|uniref:Uncharacterized protein n=1 Tax=Anabaena cylindrica (strain ATCC 27899 / PCC 7122) TaxID=272123 RepID=K9ZDY6_ANACC|nr:MULTISPECIES: hypothetical protein [Anabaena]AFZ57396.1 hypothetical protein Anacy_1908 [Anabaena cylindrica PCC 7122]MBD2421078.1 hypothetical protein [Anabaena cylindrica FACHB-243]MBY5284948.1 hypothetical protein [Anabaena sp. CCAP 1446/1C]MBY5306352.1 hypothetical protein [Anabaena sp. CCAP 1446/1C]MCM2405831.1 hypothetical protein [Anabaena sp. CCAP 1446/1C]
MKCINCGTDNNLKDRTAKQGRCKQCNHPFAFEPTSMGTVKITDPMFAKILADISANNTLYFTPKQFLYFLDNRIRKKGFKTSSFIPMYLFSNIWITGFVGGMTSAFLPNSFLAANLLYQTGTIFYLFNNTKSSKLTSASRNASSRSLQFIGILILVAGISSSLFIFNSFIVFFIVVILGMLSIFLGTRQLGKVGNLPQEFLITQSYLDSWLERWQQINGTLDKVLPVPQEKITPVAINPDVTVYSFDRLIVCDSATIAQLLIANNFHFENNCAILSINGYPQSIFNTTMEMLRRNPDLQVFALHDCSPKGVSLVHRLRTSESWFLNSDVKIIDVGLLPRQILANKRGMFVQNLAKKSTELPLEVRQSLSKEELAWLDAGNFVELESFTPQMLIKVLRSGISGSLNLESDDSSMILIGDSGNDIYMVESFG